jgi:glycosyltransferase involved in cell wall biosynthesis
MLCCGFGSDLATMSLFKNVCIVTPVYNDWESLSLLLASVDKAVSTLPISASVIVIDDGSNSRIEDDLIDFGALGSLESIEIMELSYNMGNQRALAIGLAQTAKKNDFDAVIVMDSDGEDRPEDIPKLLAEAENAPDHIIVASRTKRHDPMSFRFFYLLYQILFRVLTGNSISFGNFSVIPITTLKSLVFMPNLWNCLPATFLRSNFPIVHYALPRGSRYAGKSKMSTVALIVHGLSVISAYSDILFVRILIFSFLVAGLIIAAITAILGIKIFSDLAIPGWTSTVILALSILLFQVVVIALGALVLLLHGRSSVASGPMIDSETYIREKRLLWHKP